MHRGDSGQTPALRERLDRLCRQMCTGLVERDEPARLLLLAALAGEHALLLGPPGTAKSELARRLRGCLADAAYFERLLTKFSVPEELYGPLSIKRLEQDEYHRLTEGYLPSASVAFLDEIFNANSAILNALLTLLNERQFDNGTRRVCTPLVSVVAASNSVPEGAELDALYDRFLFRCQLEPVSDRGFSALLEPPETQAPASGDRWPITTAELGRIRQEADRVVLPEAVKALLASLRKALVDEKLYVSDRRWTKIVRVLRVAAFCDGRDEVTLADCLLVVNCLWNRPEQAPIARELVHSSLGAVLVDEPSRYEAMAAAFEDEVIEEEGRKEQACGERGEPLWYDDSGDEGTDPYVKVQLTNPAGELLFAAPPEMPASGGRTTFSLEQLWEGWFKDRPDGMAKLEAWSHNPANHALERTERRRVERPRRYSAEHLAGRQHQVTQVLGHVRAFQKAINGLRGGADSLWVPSPECRELGDRLERAREALDRVEKKLQTVVDRVDALPRSDA